MLRTILRIAIILSFPVTAFADFEPWKDYEPSDAVWSITTVKVQPNRDDDYLEGLVKTWVSGNEIAKKLGQIEDYEIYRSDLPLSGEFNLLLVVKFANTAALAPNKAQYEAFMKEFTKKRADETEEFTKTNYPGMREITGEYLFRKLTLK